MNYNYCKKCGKKLSEHSSHCDDCGTIAGSGSGYCGNCGNKVEAGQAICLKCGFYINDRPTNTTQDRFTSRRTRMENRTQREIPEYQRYEGQFKKITIFSLIAQICTILAIMALIFIPIYMAEVKIDFNDLLSLEFREELEELEKWNDMEELVKDPDFIEKGIAKKGFSFADDLKIIIDGIKEYSSEDEGIPMLAQGFMAMLPLFFVAVGLVVLGIEICKSIMTLYDCDHELMLRVDEIKRSGKLYKRLHNSSSNVWVFLFFVFMVLDVAFGKFLALIDRASLSETKSVRNMLCFSGVSGYIIIPVVILIISFVANAIKSRTEKDMMVEIIQTQY